MRPVARDGILGHLILGGLLLSFGIDAPGQEQKVQSPYPIPDEISRIFNASCLPCHGPDGGRLPGSRLNFSRWNGYGPPKEAEKASQICSVMKKGTMPPRSARDNNSVLSPTKDQEDLVCSWAESLKEKERKKK